MRFHIIFSYDGSKFSGYQKQPHKRTVQFELENALSKINGNKPVSVVSSGRTDAGVHALNQSAHFDLDILINSKKLIRALNSLLPSDIYINSVNEVKNSFHARFDVKSKEYIYIINLGTFNPIEKDYVYQYNKNLDISEMDKALKKIEGKHDFRAFVKIDEEKDDYIREIIGTKIYISEDKNKITISIIGTGFMRYMVRNIIGSIIEIGEGKYNADHVIEVLESRDRKKAGKCAPACGLYLKDVNY